MGGEIRDEEDITKVLMTGGDGGCGGKEGRGPSGQRSLTPAHSVSSQLH